MDGRGKLLDASVNPRAPNITVLYSRYRGAIRGDQTTPTPGTKYSTGSTNSTVGRGTGYQAGDNIATKINQNNSALPAAEPWKTP